MNKKKNGNTTKKSFRNGRCSRLVGHGGDLKFFQEIILVTYHYTVPNLHVSRKWNLCPYILYTKIIL